MNKAELVEEVAAEIGLTKKEVNNAVDAMTSAITDSLARGEKVTLVGFGTFLVQKRKARQGVNPQTGARISIPAKDVPKFKPGRSLREAVE
ncbi:HU family DNA-binding protein [Candidatus Aerophobetes bacterium]|jgi:DNA-binding protein HU-beta|uniref:HU family DNA-binding protein n=1 Tax=Aerophobetes bacterium TaxID=2030807 RepID=A0A523UYU2_UNCAE|nr:MAG: HU family DNA-binding protein [Candidatus Aerophobetes bacterium]TET47660.1 MAG: HU family DNA-binding protein [Candidatus Aerophobetes bacterium]